ncbi:MAG: hypothetical protein AABZ47_17845 [Planctomycetota bacterium]
MVEKESATTIDIERFWSVGPGFSHVKVHIQPPNSPAEILKRLGPSPFPRGGFPIIGFLASAFEKVSRYAIERNAESGYNEHHS